MKILRVFFIGILFPLHLFSQQWDVGGWIGISHYFGDLNTTMSFRYPRPAGGLIGRYNFTPYFALRTSLNAGFVTFSDQVSNKIFQEKRNLDFSSPVVELSAQAEFNFFKFELGNENRRFTPYLFGGAGIFYFNPKTEGEKLRPLGTEGQGLSAYPNKKKYFLIQPAVLYGAGAKFRFKKSFWSWGVEAGYRYTFTDYLDDVSTTYPDMNYLAAERGATAVALSDRSYETGDVIGEEGKQRGDSQNPDSYIFAGFTLTYTIRTIKCPNPY